MKTRWSLFYFLVSSKLSENNLNYIKTENDYKSAIDFANTKNADLFMLYTAPEGACAFCAVMDEAMKTVVNSHVEYQQENESSPVYFARLDLFEAQRVAAMHKIDGVPIFARIPKHLHIVDGRATPLPKDSQMPLLEIRKGAKVEIYMNQWINRMTGREAEIKERVPNPIVRVIKSITLLIMVLLLVIFTRRLVIRVPWTISLIYMCFYFISTCGLINVIIHEAPLYGEDPSTGRITIFHHGKRSQYMLEGFIAAGAMSLAAVSFYLFGLVQRLNFVTRKNINFVGLLLFIFGYYTWNWALQMFQTKLGFPENSFFPPADFVRGPLINDRQSSY